MRSFEETEAHLIEVAQRCYTEPNERAAMRGALMDAAALCDAWAAKIRDAHLIRGGKRVSKTGQNLAHVATECADLLQAMRDKIRSTA